MSLSFQPFLAWPWLAAFALFVLAACGLLAWKRERGAFLRLAAGAALLAALLNPVTMIAVGMALPYALPQPLRTWLHGAGINIGWLFAYGVSIIVLWRAPVEEPQDA